MSVQISRYRNEGVEAVCRIANRQMIRHDQTKACSHCGACKWNKQDLDRLFANRKGNVPGEFLNE
jgi:hypothetical protein